jgi:hypothetical protein
MSMPGSGTATREWIETPRGISVSAERISDPYREAATMDVDDFNRDAEEYGLHMSADDPPILKLFKYDTFLKRSGDWDEDSFVPSNIEYVNALLDAATAYSGGQEPLRSFYISTLLHNCPEHCIIGDITRDVLEFQEEMKGMYIFTLFQVREDGILEPVDNITVPNHDGHILQLGNYKYPTEVSDGMNHFGSRPLKVQGCEVPGFVRGIFRTGDKPERGEKRLVIHLPYQCSLTNRTVNIDIEKDWNYIPEDGRISLLPMKI